MRALLIAIAVALVALPSVAQVLYKWTDPEGKVIYSDRLPPKGFAGKVEKIEPDVAPTPTDRPPVEPRAAPAPSPAAAAPGGLAAQRRSTREKLQARVDAARAKVEAARKALDEGSDIAPEDRRTLVQRVDGSTALRSSCRIAKGSDGKNVTLCAASIPTEAYRERVEQLDAALHAAEGELDEALSAYGHGVD